jgi:hypothetical protein
MYERPPWNWTALRLLGLLAILAMLRPSAALPQEDPRPEFYTLQLGSYAETDSARKVYDQLSETLPPRLHDLLRIERIGPYDALRLGDFGEKAPAQDAGAKLKELGVDWLLLQAPIRPERLILPPSRRTQRQPPARRKGPPQTLPGPFAPTPAPEPKKTPTATKERGPEGNRFVLHTAERMLDESRPKPAAERPADWLIQKFMRLGCSQADVTQAALDSLQALAREARSKRGLDLRFQWRGDYWDKQDAHHFDRNRFRLGLTWDIIEDGFLETRRRAMNREDEMRLERLDANAARLDNQFVCRDLAMALHFARLRLEPLERLKRLQKLYLDDLTARYHAGDIFLDQVVEVQTSLAETRKHIDTLRRGLQMLPGVGTDLPAAPPPILDLDTDALLGGLARQAENDAERLEVKKRILEREHDDLYDLDVEVFADAGADLDRAGSQQDARTGVSVRIPLDTGGEEPVVNALLREERVNMAKDRRERKLNLVRRANSYREKLADALDMHGKRRLTRERLRRAVLAHDIRPDPSTRVLGESLARVAKQAIEHLKVQVEMLAVKESLYRRLLYMLTRAETPFEPAMVAQWSPEALTRSVRPGSRAVYIWSGTFNAAPNAYILELLRAKGIHRAMVSAGENTDAGKLARFIAKAPSRGVTVSLLYGINAWLDPARREQALDRLKRDARVVARVHLDVEPQATDRYDQQDLVQLVRQVRNRLGPDVELSVSVTPRIQPGTAAELAEIANKLYVMAYNDTKPEALLQELSNFQGVDANKIVLALRPSDFTSEQALENLLNNMVQRHNISNFALHDLEGYMHLAGEGGG